MIKTLILDLQVHKTGHRGVKVELPILGENHAQLCHVLRPVDVHSPHKEIILTNNSQPYYTSQPLLTLASVSRRTTNIWKRKMKIGNVNWLKLKKI